MRLTLQWKWFLGLAGLLLVLLGVVDAVLNNALRRHMIGYIRRDLEQKALLAAETLAGETLSETNALELANRTSGRIHLRITIIAADGRVIGESGRPAAELAQIENHLSRPEVQAALQRGVGSSIRHSGTVNDDLMYAAAPLRRGGVIRLALPLAEVRTTTGQVRRLVASASALVVLLALPLVFLLSHRVTGPIERMRAMAIRVAAGEFSASAPERGGSELRELGQALNQMSGQLKARLEELASEKAELQATLSNMVEGVLVVDPHLHVRLVNASLARQFNLQPGTLGRTVMEAFRHAQLQELLAVVLGGQETATREMLFFGEEERVFDVTAAQLRNGQAAAHGAVAVFHDITRIKKLERIRKEFVANASHELRTPLAVVRGYLENLLDENPPDAATTRQFLQTMDRNVVRLEALIGDLLYLSEMEAQAPRLNLEPLSLRALAEDVLSELAHPASKKQIALSLDLPPDLPAVAADAHRLHQVFVNLLDNAIKYTQPGGEVRISARAGEREIEVRVADNGPGIPAEHLDRIFERFYRVDKARSRELGGTGLGLSIVKHIVQAHGGRVWAESRPGHGSAFFFTLPMS